jgi:hypothetical protein
VVLTLAVAAVLAATVGAVRSQLAATGDDPRVDLPVATGSVQPGLRGEAARDALAPFAADRLRCQPLGCERWSLDLPGRLTDATTVGDLLVLLIDLEELVAVDPVSGGVAWRTAAVPEASTRARRRPGAEVAFLAAEGEQLLVGWRNTDLRLVDRHGRVRWTAALAPPAWIWGATFVGSSVVTFGPPPSPADGNVQVHAYGRATGRDRWTTVVDSLVLAEPGHPLIARDEEGGLVRLDEVTGAATPLPIDAEWITPLVGPLGLILTDPDGVGGPAVVVDLDTGATTTSFGGLPDAVAPYDDGVVVLAGRDRLGGRPELVALDLDGAVRWRRAAPLAPADLTVQDGVVHLTLAPDHHAVVDLATGRDLPAAGPAPAPLEGGVVEHVEPGAHLTVRTAGGRVVVTPTDAWVLPVDPPVVARSHQLLGIRPVPEEDETVAAG